MSSHDPAILEKTLREEASTPISPLEKGFAVLGPITPNEVVAREIRLQELTLPLMVLREPALASNTALMAAWCRDRDVLHAPHGKTPMSPQIVARQLREGDAWGITAATVGQVRAFADWGVRRILLANQLVDPAGIAWLARALRELPDLEVIAYVDTVEGVDLLDRELSRAGVNRPLPVLVELGVPGRRTGARSVEAAERVAEQASRTSTLKVVGASAFEGVIGHDRDDATLERVAGLCRDVRRLGLSIADEPIVSAGGSTYFDVVAEALSGSEPSKVVVRSGGYVTHDDGLYSEATPLPDDLKPAIDVWAYVLSRPEPTRVLAGAGRRDLPYDVKLPIVRDDIGATVVSLNDQHAFLDVDPSSPLEVGDRVRFGIAHPCTAFDKWRVIPIVDDSGRVLEIARTYF